MRRRTIVDFLIGVFPALAVSVALSAWWWCSEDCSPIGWMLILGIFMVPAAAIAFTIALVIADWAGRFVPRPLQVLIVGLLPALMIFLFYLPMNMGRLHGDFGSRPQSWILWHVFRDVTRGAAVTMPGGLLGGLLTFYGRPTNKPQ